VKKKDISFRIQVSSYIKSESQQFLIVGFLYLNRLFGSKVKNIYK